MAVYKSLPPVYIIVNMGMPEIDAMNDFVNGNNRTIPCGARGFACFSILAHFYSPKNSSNSLISEAEMAT